MKTNFDVVYGVWIWNRQSENHKTFEGLGIEFLSFTCHFEYISLYI